MPWFLCPHSCSTTRFQKCWIFAARSFDLKKSEKMLREVRGKSQQFARPMWNASLFWVRESLKVSCTLMWTNRVLTILCAAWCVCTRSCRFWWYNGIILADLQLCLWMHREIGLSESRMESQSGCRHHSGNVHPSGSSCQVLPWWLDGFWQARQTGLDRYHWASGRERYALFLFCKKSCVFHFVTLKEIYGLRGTSSLSDHLHFTMLVKICDAKDQLR